MRARVLIGVPKGVLKVVVIVAVLVGAAACGSGAGAGGTSPASVSQVTSSGPRTGNPSGNPSRTSSGTPSTASSPPTETVSQPPSTVVTTPTDPTLVPPPPSTPEPAPTAAACPYLSAEEVAQANGQRTSKTATIATEPYPICVFYRPDGTVMAVTRIVVADSPAAAAAAVNQHVPIDRSFPVTHPAGWTGGAMPTPDGVPGYPDAGSIYAVSKGTIAVIAVSNQKQSIKGRQMVTQIVANLGL